MRTTRIPVLAAAVLLAAGGFAAAQDNTPRPARDTGFTITLAGTGTAAEAAADDDTELTYWLRRRMWGWGYPGGYTTYYGGYGYGGYGYGGFGYGGWGGNYYAVNYTPVQPVVFRPFIYRPFVYRPFVYRPFVYRPFVYRPFLIPRAIPYVAFGGGYYRFIEGDADALDTPVITLGSTTRPHAPVVFPIESLVDHTGTFRYDGGPANPVPLPNTGSTSARAEGSGLPVSLRKSTPYSFKAYGEK